MSKIGDFFDHAHDGCLACHCGEKDGRGVGVYMPERLHLKGEGAPEGALQES